MTSFSNLTGRKLSEVMNVDLDRVYWLADSTPEHYREVVIDQGNKKRKLLVPGPGLKSFQEEFYDTYLAEYSYHDAVYCCPDRGVHDAVQRHVRHPYLLHLDIKSFFPSVGVDDVRRALKNAGVHNDFVSTLTRLLTVNYELPQGAPTSVGVGNLVLEEMDKQVGNFCEKHGLTYTRYIDDLAISGGSRLEKLESNIRKYIEDTGWSLNQKGGLFGPEDEHSLLGLVADVELNIGKEYVNELKDVIERWHDDGNYSDAISSESIRGKINWVKQAEPEIGRELQNRFKKAVTEV